MCSLVQDIGHGDRTLLKSRGFTLVTVVTLALEIGANTVFTLVARWPRGSRPSLSTSTTRRTIRRKPNLTCPHGLRFLSHARSEEYSRLAAKCCLGIGPKVLRSFVDTVPATDIWSEVSNLTRPRSWRSALAMNGKIYVIDGSRDRRTIAVVDEFDPNTL